MKTLQIGIVEETQKQNLQHIEQRISKRSNFFLLLILTQISHINSSKIIKQKTLSSVDLRELLTRS